MAAVSADTEESLPNIVVNQVLRQEGRAATSAREEWKIRRTKETSPPGVLTISVVVPVHAWWSQWDRSSEEPGRGAYGGRGELLGLGGGEHFLDGLVERRVAHAEVKVADAEIVEGEERPVGSAFEDCYSVT